ncbi:MAG: hypothetical protein JRN35_09410 [Nitrososphaerota archaeon]|nr:hypothetical protein [Nitrososphaerota archaeon]
MDKAGANSLEAEIEYWRVESVRAAMAGRVEDLVKARVQFYRARNLLGLLVATQQLLG